MTDKKTVALKLALDALEETRNALAWFYDSYPQDVTPKGNELLPHVETILARLREALAVSFKAEYEAAPQEDPCPGCRKGGVCRTPKCGRLKLPADHPLRSEQPAQDKEPCGWRKKYNGEWAYSFTEDAWDFIRRVPPAQQQEPSKPWVQATTWRGLTRAERFEIEKAMSKYYDYQHECKTVCLPEFARAIEAKLKEKNYGK